MILSLCLNIFNYTDYTAEVMKENEVWKWAHTAVGTCKLRRDIQVSRGISTVSALSASVLILLHIRDAEYKTEPSDDLKMHTPILSRCSGPGVRSR